MNKNNSASCGANKKYNRSSFIYDTQMSLLTEATPRSSSLINNGSYTETENDLASTIVTHDKETINNASGFTNSIADIYRPTRYSNDDVSISHSNSFESFKHKIQSQSAIFGNNKNASNVIDLKVTSIKSDDADAAAASSSSSDAASDPSTLTKMDLLNSTSKVDINDGYDDTGVFYPNNNQITDADSEEIKKLIQVLSNDQRKLNRYFEESYHIISLAREQPFDVYCKQLTRLSDKLKSNEILNNNYKTNMLNSDILIAQSLMKVNLDDYLTKITFEICQMMKYRRFLKKLFRAYYKYEHIDPIL